MIKYLKEIKNRTILLLLNYLSVNITIYYHKEIFLFAITNPKSLLNFKSINVEYFIFTDVTELFFVYFRLIIFFSAQIFFLFLIYHIFIFFSYGMFKKEYKFFKLTIKTVFLIWVISSYISNNLLIPLSWNFFIGFQNNLLEKKFFRMHFEAKIVEYFSFYTSIYSTYVMYFQIVLLAFTGIHYFYNALNSAKKFRKINYFIFLNFFTVLSNDVLSQFVITNFCILLYEIFIFFLFLKTRLQHFNRIRDKARVKN